MAQRLAYSSLSRQSSLVWISGKRPNVRVLWRGPTATALVVSINDVCQVIGFILIYAPPKNKTSNEK